MNLIYQNYPLNNPLLNILHIISVIGINNIIWRQNDTKVDLITLPNDCTTILVVISKKFNEHTNKNVLQVRIAKSINK